MNIDFRGETYGVIKKYPLDALIGYKGGTYEIVKHSDCMKFLVSVHPEMLPSVYSWNKDRFQWVVVQDNCTCELALAVLNLHIQLEGLCI